MCKGLELTENQMTKSLKESSLAGAERKKKKGVASDNVKGSRQVYFKKLMVTLMVMGCHGNVK